VDHPTYAQLEAVAELEGRSVVKVAAEAITDFLKGKLTDGSLKAAAEARRAKIQKAAEEELNALDGILAGINGSGATKGEQEGVDQHHGPRQGDLERVSIKPRAVHSVVLRGVSITQFEADYKTIVIAANLRANERVASEEVRQAERAAAEQARKAQTEEKLERERAEARSVKFD
jgi:hypothetical protein